MNIIELLKRMSTREKVCQLFQGLASFYDGKQEFATGPLAALNLSEKDLYAIGSVLNVKGATEAIEVKKKYIERSNLKIPLLIMQDVIHGYKTIYPINIAMASTFDENVIRECSSVAAKEASVAGIDVTFAPMIDVSRDARWGRCAEGSGEDTYLGRVCARSAVQGFQGDFGRYNVAACAKHFVGYGAAESGKDYNVVEMSYQTLYNTYLPPFEEAIKAGVEMIMSAFHTFDGVPMSANKRLLSDSLRTELGFKGTVISDWAAIWETIPHGVCEDEKDAAEACFAAGVDIEMMTACYLKSLEKIVESDKASSARLDAAVLRILELKEKLGLFENPFRSASEEECEKYFLCAEHRDIVRRAAEESVVLLKNDGVLPLKNKRKIAVIGKLGDSGEILGCWRGMGKSEDTVTLAQGLRNIYGDESIECAVGCDCYYTAKDESRIAEAVELAKNSDAVILCLGESQYEAGESNSKARIELPDVQYKLFDAVSAVNGNVVAVLFTGRPLAIEPLAEKVRAIICAWFPGTEGGNALARIISGKISPSGKLPMSFPRASGQCPVYYNHQNTGRPRPDKKCPEGCTSSYADILNRPLYAFGYGLSYTKFEYSSVEISSTEFRRGDRVRIGIKVRNSGECDGTEVVQLYIRDDVAKVARPVKELKGFCRVDLKRGEEKQVAFTIEEEDLTYYDQNLTRRVDSGSFTVFVGGDSNCDEVGKIRLIH